MSSSEISVLETSEIFSQRENGLTHTAYETEVLFYNCIKSGDCEKTKEMMDFILSQNIVAGKMSNDALRQMKYWAVCCITLATRYAIAGGLDETTAFNYSDEAIMKIDVMENKAEIMALLKKLCLELTTLVSKSGKNASYPYAVRRCLHIINTRLHEKLSLKMLADECSLSPDYLSALFKKTTGVTLTAYIKEKRLEAAKDMLQKKYATSEVAYFLGFCSESYFIKCFREHFGITPKKYIDMIKL
ncbi:MAG: helix-turn-helix domain-containing protein [Acutalibacteraceae bacterium]